jgi:hypothetical protein
LWVEAIRRQAERTPFGLARLVLHQAKVPYLLRSCPAVVSSAR